MITKHSAFINNEIWEIVNLELVSTCWVVIALNIDIRWKALKCISLSNIIAGVPVTVAASYK